MSASSASIMNMDGQPGQYEANKPIWLDSFLSKTFFDPCSVHSKKCKNGLKRYCIACDIPICQYCVTAGLHRHHNVLKIYKHFYKEVVSLTAIAKHINCSQIQPYKRNKRLTISLHPLPQSESTSNDDASCSSCRSKLNDPNSYHYCSISCMAKVVFSEKDDSVPEESQAETTPSLRKRKRKGTPHRAPFF